MMMGLSVLMEQLGVGRLQTAPLAGDRFGCHRGEPNMLGIQRVGISLLHPGWCPGGTGCLGSVQKVCGVLGM